MNEPRARFPSWQRELAQWDRARRAYRDLLAGADPAAEAIGFDDFIDLRPAGPETQLLDGTGPLVVVSGPSDLVELREIVESATGVGTWPQPVDAPGELRAAQLEVDRVAPLLALLMAMEGLIEDRSPWRNWRTAVDTMATQVRTLEHFTVEACVIVRAG